MSSSIQTSYIAHRLGDVRQERAATAAAPTRRGFDGTKGLSAMLLAAMVSSLVVVADQLVETWVNGHLMVAWIALWAVCFTAMAMFAGAARKLAVASTVVFNAWRAKKAQQRSDERLWAVAQTDPRMMADISAAMARSD